MKQSQTKPIADVAGTTGSVAGANQGNPTTKECPGPLALILMAVYFGLVTGLLELVVLSCLWFADPTTRLGARLVNRHYLWMIPFAHLVIFGVGGLALGLIGRIWPRAALRLSVYLLCGLASLALLLLIPALHRLTYFLLACGVASVAGPLIEARIRRVRLHVRRALPWLVGTVVALTCYSYGRELLSEYRARRRLPAAIAGAPNVLLIVLDTVRADALSLYGYHRDTSPNMARLASRGVRFERAVATAPWTLPSHASMFTGRWPNQLGVGWFRPLDASYPTLAEVLAAQGYETSGFVANPMFCHADYGLARGFVHYEDIPVSPLGILRSIQLGRRLLKIIDRVRYKLSELVGDEMAVGVFDDDPRASLWDSHSRKDAARINRDALDWISVQRSRPFFMFLNYFDAHDPYFPPRGADRHFGLEPSTPSQRATIRDWSSNLDKAKAPSTTKLARDSYDDCLAYLDDHLGRLFNELDLRGVLENTLVMITSDHGEHFGEHDGIYGHWQSLYPQEIRVPLLVIAPGRVPSGRVISAPVSLRDLPATVVDVAGLGLESSFPGRSLARYWDPAAAGRPSSAEPAFAELEKEWLRLDETPRLWHSLSIGDMVYIRNPNGDEELYNIAADPAAEDDLAGSADAHPILEQFRASLQSLRADVPGRGNCGGAEVHGLVVNVKMGGNAMRNSVSGSRSVPDLPSQPGPKPPESKPMSRPAAPPRPAPISSAGPASTPSSADIPVGIALSAGTSEGGTVTSRKAGGLRDMALEVNPHSIGVKAALQHLAKAVNIAFQTDFGENYLESVYQAAIVRRNELHIIHREYFGFGDNWFGQFGRLIRSLQLTLEGPDPASPEGQQRIAEKGPATIRGILSLIGRKLDVVAEYEDRVPAYVEQMFDRLEGSGIILGWDRNDWEIWTTSIGLDIRIAPRPGVRTDAEAAPSPPAP